MKSIGTITGQASGQLRIILCKQHLLCFLFMKMICMFQGVNLQRATSIITTCQPCRLACHQLKSCSFSSDRRRVSRLAFYQKMGSIRPRYGDGLFSSQERWSRKMSAPDQLSDQKSAAPLVDYVFCDFTSRSCVRCRHGSSSTVWWRTWRRQCGRELDYLRRCR